MYETHDLTRWETTGQAALRLRRTPQRVKQLSNEGKLRTVRLANGTRLIDPASVDELIAVRASRSAA